MENKEYERKMLEEGFSPEVIKSRLKESGYHIRKTEPKKRDKESSQGLRDLYEYFNSILRNFKNAF